MIDELPKAKQFYKLMENKFMDSDHWSRNMFPIKFQTRVESMAFKTAFDELDEVQRDQWFDHHYSEAYSCAVFGEQLLRARELLILLLKVAVLYELTPSKPYEFERLIHACWIQPYTKLEEVKESLKGIYAKAGFRTSERETRNNRKKTNNNCGCLKSDCSIF